MPRHVLFIQGAGEGVHDTWDDKLVDSLRRELGDGYIVLYPRMPDEADPHYATWQPVVLKAIEGMADEAIVVGHSVGGAILIHALIEWAPKRNLGGLFLIAAPFIGKEGWPSDEMAPRTDFAERLPPGLLVFLYHGTKDDIVPAGHVDLYAKCMPKAVIRRLEGRNHQIDNDLAAIARDIKALGDSGH